jgi:hypothetical protein
VVILARRPALSDQLSIEVSAATVADSDQPFEFIISIALATHGLRACDLSEALLILTCVSRYFQIGVV